IKVVGTAFNVRAEPHRTQVEVSVSEGTVHFMTGSDQKDFVELNAGQFAIYDEATHSLAQGYASIPFIGHWKENKLVFEQEPLEDAFRKIEKWYGYKIVISRKQLLNQLYNARFDAPKLEELLRSMAFVLGFRY
ncbi:FecR family protein, partial [Vibrio casei]